MDYFELAVESARAALVSLNVQVCPACGGRARLEATRADGVRALRCESCQHLLLVSPTRDTSEGAVHGEA